MILYLYPCIFFAAYSCGHRLVGTSLQEVTLPVRGWVSFKRKEDFALPGAAFINFYIYLRN
jgi:hypothetical protein